MSPELARLGHVAMVTPDVEESLFFFEDAVGMEEVDRDGDAVYLRAPDEFDHHSIRLREGDRAGVDHIGWQTADRESLDGFADRLESEGLDVSWVDAGEEAGQGEAIRFETPSGHRFEFYAEMDSPDAPEERRSKLRNKPYATPGTNPVAPRRIDHVQIWDENAHEFAEWLQDVLGLRVQEYYDNDDGSRWGTFLSANGIKIEAAVIQGEGDGPLPAMHHVAYKVYDDRQLFDAADAMRELDIPRDGFGQHSISRGKFLYAHDPVSGHRIEFNGGGYLVFDPNWEPVAWKEGDLSDRQWVGQITGLEAVPYY